MPKTTHALYNLVSQFFEKPDEASLLTDSRLFRHAIATPLSGLLLNLELAKTHQENPYLSSAYRQAERLKKLLQLSSAAKTNPRLFRVKPAIREITLMLSGHYRSAVLRNHLVISEKSTLLGNRFLFQEALLCTIKNAFESYQVHQHKLVLLRVTETDDQVILSISDGGRGFTRLQRTLAFADGFSTKAGHQGVGMAYTKKVIERHLGGKVVLLSKPGRGSTITWYLPKPA